MKKKVWNVMDQIPVKNVGKELPRLSWDIAQIKKPTAEKEPTLE